MRSSQHAQRKLDEMRRRGVLPAQVEERAEQYGAEKVREAEEQINKGMPVPEPDVPDFIVLTEEQKKQQYLERVRALAKMEFHRRWRRDHDEEGKRIDAACGLGRDPGEEDNE